MHNFSSNSTEITKLSLSTSQQSLKYNGLQLCEDEHNEKRQSQNNVFYRRDKNVYIHTSTGQTLEGCMLENEEYIYKDKDGF